MGMGRTVGGAASGAATGAMVGGPIGAVAGGVLGAFLSGGGGGDKKPPPRGPIPIDDSVERKMAENARANSEVWKKYEAQIGGYNNYQPPTPGGAPVWQAPEPLMPDMGAGMGRSMSRAGGIGANAFNKPFAHESYSPQEDSFQPWIGAGGKVKTPGGV